MVGLYFPGEHVRVLPMKWMALGLLASLAVARAQFALKDDGKFFTVDCESVPKTVVEVNKSNGNLQSILVNGIQLQKNPRGSHINSGFGSSQVTAKAIGDDRILITVNSPIVTHYYAFKKGEPAVFMATWSEPQHHLR
ncbi:MAG: rhamnogalacturonan lyase B N-terminal domain-containing protein [Luteolibacter sp.]